MDAATEQGARRFLERIRDRYQVAGAILFGSRARGDADQDSDADLALLLRDQPLDRYRVAVDMAGVAFDVMLETGVLVEPLPLSEHEWEHPEQSSNRALLEAIRREGVAL